jgi:hypothetical protein
MLPRQRPYTWKITQPLRWKRYLLQLPYKSMWLRSLQFLSMRLRFR